MGDGSELTLYFARHWEQVFQGFPDLLTSLTGSRTRLHFLLLFVVWKQMAAMSEQRPQRPKRVRFGGLERTSRCLSRLFRLGCTGHLT